MPTLDTDRGPIRYATSGEGETLVFLNEAGLGVWQWSFLQPALAGPYETVVWDTPGTGDATDRDRTVTLDALVTDLDAVLSAIEARRVHLVGGGLGGLVALEYAREHGRVATVAALCTAPGDAIDADALGTLAAPRDDPGALRDSLSVAFAPGVVDAHPDVIDRLVGWRADEDADPDTWNAYRETWLDAELPAPYEITTPALVVGAAEDAIVPPAATARLAEDLPRGEHRAVEGGHLCWASESRVVADELLAWLDERIDEEN